MLPLILFKILQSVTALVKVECRYFSDGGLQQQPLFVQTSFENFSQDLTAVLHQRL